MTDFDQLIKNKAEQAQYSYKPSAWKRFLKHSGTKVGLSGLQIAAVTIASVAVVGGAVWGVSALKNQSAVENEIPAPQVETMVIDTVQQKNIVVTEEPASTTVAPKTVAKSQAEPVATAEPVVEKTTDPQTMPAAQPRKKTSRPLGRPVIINVDTITVMEPTDEELRKGNSRLF